ncbi:MAG: sugar ABC transporter permease [Bacilli bacterium]|nr:sugar ABC transporter permease [Bacilli bacterium]
MEKRNNYKAWLYLAPALILMAVFTFFPLVNTIIVSFIENYNSAYGFNAEVGERVVNTGFTFKNYGVVLGITPRNPSTGVLDKTFLSFTGPSALGNTLMITFITVPISVVIALVISIALNQIKVLKKFFQTVFFMPYVTNIIAVGMVFSIIFSTNGIFNAMLKSNTNWINVGASYWNSMLILFVYIIWNALPYKILIFLSGLQNIDKQYYDAAKIDGASAFKVARKVTIPLLSPQILYITITSFIGAFKEYTAIVGLFNRSYTADGNVPDLFTVVYYIYDKLNSTDQVQYASAAAVILFIIIMLITLVQMKVAKKRVHY